MERDNKKLIETLVRGKSSAKALKNLIRKKLVNGNGSGRFDDLLVDILGSFSGGLLMLGACDSGEISGGAPASPPVDPVPEVYSGKKPAPVAKERRGCYKRRKTQDSRVKISGTIEDGYAWRKYGQKEILNSKSPRCYFRCTHKPAHGCKAQRQVQKLEDGSEMFHITYFGHHTCPSPNSFSKNGVVLDFKDSKNHPYFSSSPSTITNVPIDTFVKQEVEYSKAQSTDVSDNVSSANEGHSAPPLGWNEVLRGDFGESFMGFDHEDSSASTSSHSYLMMDMDFINHGEIQDDFEFEYPGL
ncbi:probable WRKY transcription factor 70 [Tanacetum coccineum]|uniref:Probable WRKY transcription factor 70 n=1 Tax=Tanacetum coccineum TaxID=301880 RepID=A0ABQ4XLW9_9ASTR